MHDFSLTTRWNLLLVFWDLFAYRRKMYLFSTPEKFFGYLNRFFNCWWNRALVITDHFYQTTLHKVQTENFSSHSKLLTAKTHTLQSWSTLDTRVFSALIYLSACLMTVNDPTPKKSRLRVSSPSGSQPPIHSSTSSRTSHFLGLAVFTD